jgi:hypothetical protein
MKKKAEKTTVIALRMPVWVRDALKVEADLEDRQFAAHISRVLKIHLQKNSVAEAWAEDVGKKG